ncbi:MAG: hypothetical protein Ct9H300mP11_23080 [Chloroflexota bacterium]|nr:MAG: hypothetical protein Ct9H300mP11_23080 [Chloroflexota bacterium]
MGAYQAYDWPTVLAVLGIVLAAGYILWMMQRTFFGVRRDFFNDLPDASLVEALPLGLMLITIIGVGVYPFVLTDVFESGLNPMVDVLNGVITRNVSPRFLRPITYIAMAGAATNNLVGSGSSKKRVVAVLDLRSPGGAIAHECNTGY